ncbi:MAG: hypothetical protein HYU51_18445 [Candidatus Rokubacteria bacterium]|nr:hypothetical protein [Candidatus Rokubacteria bacterium]
MPAAGLERYAEVALVIAILGFVVVVVALLRRKNQDLFERARHMPLDDGSRAPRPDAPPARDDGPTAPRGTR